MRRFKKRCKSIIKKELEKKFSGFFLMDVFLIMNTMTTSYTLYIHSWDLFWKYPLFTPISLSEKSQPPPKHTHNLKLPKLIESININPLTQSLCEKTKDNAHFLYFLNTDIVRYTSFHYCFLTPWECDAIALGL